MNVRILPKPNASRRTTSHIHNHCLDDECELVKEEIPSFSCEKQILVRKGEWIGWFPSDEIIIVAL